MIYIIDTETTGIANTDQIIELAWINVGNEVSSLEPLDTFQQYYKPSVPIHPKAQEVHGLSADKLKNYPSSILAKIPADTSIGIFHNASFDMRMLGKPDIKSICTMKLAKKITKELNVDLGGSNSLRNLFTFFYPDLSGDFLTLYHGAEADCKMTLAILIALLKFYPHIETLEQLERYIK